MASKKKLPHSRRGLNSEKLGVYCYCTTDLKDSITDPCRKICIEKHDATDRGIAHRKSSGDLSDKFLDVSTLQIDHVDRDNVSRRRELPPHDHKPEFNVYTGPPFTWLDFIFGFSSIGFFFFDIVTDILLARDYYHQQNMSAFGLTSGFIIIPSIVTCALNFRWYLLDYQNQQLLVKNYGKENVKQTSMALWITRFILTLLMMGPVIRQIEYLYNGHKSSRKYLTEQEKKRHYTLMRMEAVDACCIRMFECFLEAAPQLILQIYILMHHTQKETWFLEGIRAVAILSSWASLSWSMVAYQKALRFSHEDKENITIPGMICQFLWRACEIGPRVIALGLFAGLYHYFVFVVAGVHWMLMSAWLFCQNTQFYQNRCEERFFNIVCGYVFIFCFLNVRDGRTRYRMLLYYCIVYIENWVMMGFWFYFTDDKSMWYYVPTFFVVSLGVVLQIFFQLLYYGCFHPMGRGKIPCCPKRGEYSCFQSLCHDLEPHEPQNVEYEETAYV